MQRAYAAKVLMPKSIYTKLLPKTNNYSCIYSMKQRKYLLNESLITFTELGLIDSFHRRNNFEFSNFS